MPVIHWVEDHPQHADHASFKRLHATETLAWGGV